MSKKRKQLIFLGIITILIVFFILIFFIKDLNIKNGENKSISNKEFKTELSNETVSPSPFPFQELTIPYLRAQNFQSELGELVEVDSNANYTSYLTSYDSEGLNINSLLTIPAGEAPAGGWPAVVFLHGYIPPQNYQTQRNYADYVDYLANNGLVVLKIDYRGHGNSDGEASGAYYSGDYIIDTLHAYSALENADFVNKAKIFLWGHSMSGNIVMRTLAAKPTIPKVSIWAGAVYTYDDFQSFRISDASYQPPDERSEHSNNHQELRDTYGNFDSSSWFWQQVPATNYLDGITGEVQIHHAVNDATVDIGYSRELDEILSDAGISHELFEYQTGGHNISGTSFTQAMRRTADFFNDL